MKIICQERADFVTNLERLSYDINRRSICILSHPVKLYTSPQMNYSDLMIPKATSTMRLVCGVTLVYYIEITTREHGGPYSQNYNNCQHVQDEETGKVGQKCAQPQLEL